MDFNKNHFGQIISLDCIIDIIVKVKIYPWIKNEITRCNRSMQSHDSSILTTGNGVCAFKSDRSNERTGGIDFARIRDENSSRERFEFEN